MSNKFKKVVTAAILRPRLSRIKNRNLTENSSTRVSIKNENSSIIHPWSVFRMPRPDRRSLILLVRCPGELGKVRVQAWSRQQSILVLNITIIKDSITMPCRFIRASSKEIEKLSSMLVIRPLSSTSGKVCPTL